MADSGHLEHMPARPLRFGPGGRFELRPAEYKLLVDGQPAALGARALDVLIALAARPHQVLTKSELLATVWRGLVVEENNLRVQVNALRRLLGEDAIATVPGRGYRLSVVLQAPPQASTAATAADAAPAPPPGAPRLYGRGADRSHLAARLRDGGGCTTLLGMPGVGKSSLARDTLAGWTGPGAWVDLAPLTQAEQLPGAIARTIARALGLQLADGEGGDPVAQVRRQLPSGGDPLLLVLDNAEHLAERCAVWAAGLADAPGLRLLVTSQRPLGVAGERLLRIEPLAVEPAGDANDGALALLLDRIAAADSRFQVAPDARPLLAALARQLDGLPLALEMAAARVPLMGLRAVHDALAERFALLSRGRRDSPARHRTLHDALAWSVGLLGDAEQRLFRMLGVFAGGFTLDLAVTLTADEDIGRWDIVDGLAALVERSLVGVSGDDPPRYRLLETMRAYALDSMTADEQRSVRRRHAAAVLALLVRGESDAQSLAEMDNVRDALQWAREHELATAAQLSARAAQLVGFTPWRQEATDWMLQLQPAMQAHGDALPLPTQAQWWSALAYLLNVRRDPAAEPAAQRAVALWRRLDQPNELLTALIHRVRSIGEAGAALDAACAELQQQHAAASGLPPRTELRVHGALAEAARVRGDHVALLACREQELRLAREQGWNAMAQAAETNVCAALIELGRHPEAAERARALLQRIEDAGADDNANRLWALYMLGEALLPMRAFAEARAVLPQLLAAERRFGTGVAWRWILSLVEAQRHWRSAGRLLGFVAARRALRQDAVSPDEQQLFDRVAGAVQAALGAETAAALSSEGRGLDEGAAAALAVATVD
ncbi:ATP-binding protein [Aquabacterium humicola]|uniref:ATP-binding protein n=1 Tax=Aquabacterium humicola TaxID=3237377 RepID=UPI0025427894|nr:winged helix-turn-helix domain-containing protein [Rubrivivax pictus]